MTRNRWWQGVLFFICATAAQAQDSLPSAAIRAATVDDGSVVVELGWILIDSCRPPLHISGQPSTVAITGPSIAIATNNGFWDCPGPGPYPPTPQAHRVNIGPLPDGIYSVHWSFPHVYNFIVITPVVGTFEVRQGQAALASAIPTLSEVGVALLSLVLALAMPFARRRRVAPAARFTPDSSPGASSRPH